MKRVYSRFSTARNPGHGTMFCQDSYHGRVLETSSATRLSLVRFIVGKGVKALLPEVTDLYC